MYWRSRKTWRSCCGAGKGPTDLELTEAVEQLLEGYFERAAYGGAVVADRGKPRMQVLNENLHRKRVPRSEEDLNLLLMRSTRPSRWTGRVFTSLLKKPKSITARTNFVLNYQGAKYIFGMTRWI